MNISKFPSFLQVYYVVLTILMSFEINGKLYGFSLIFMRLRAKYYQIVRISLLPVTQDLPRLVDRSHIVGMGISPKIVKLTTELGFSLFNRSVGTPSLQEGGKGSSPLCDPILFIIFK